MPDAHTAPEGPSREPATPRSESPSEPPSGLLRALAGVARHEAAIRAYHEAALRQQRLEERRRAGAAERDIRRAEREGDRAAQEADRTHREAARVQRAALRAELERYVRALRGRGVPPERVLVLVKRLVTDVAKTAEPPLHEAGALTDEVVHWTLDAYFSAA